VTKRIFLTGFMGSGKSKIGRLLAKKLNTKFVDTDDVIESRYKKTITQIFDDFGEEKFRKIEKDIISEFIYNNEKAVFSLGGGSLLNKQNLKLITKSGLLIYIKSGLEEIWERTKNNTKRPLLLIEGKFPTKTEFMKKANSLREGRLPGYINSQIVIDRDGKEAEEVVEEILAEINI
jgi:shikimate kinase